jgi:hypothetical protein
MTGAAHLLVLAVVVVTAIIVLAVVRWRRARDSPERQ